MARQVTIASGKNNVELPNGQMYNAGAVVILTDAQFAAISQSLIPGTVIDNGIVVGVEDQVITQAADVAAPAALTAATNATANAATQTGSYVQADVQSIAALANSLKTTQNALVADITALRTTVAAILTALKGTGKPMA